MFARALFVKSFPAGNTYVLKMSKKFLLEFISCFQNEPALWDANGKAYKSKHLRNKSWAVLLKKFKELDEQATIETVKKKVNSLRASYRREHQKIKSSQTSGAGADDIYKPTIWYFKKLDFLYDQDNGFKTEGPKYEIPKATKRKYDKGAEVLHKAVVGHLDSKKPRDDADIFAEGWALMFRQLSKEQQLFAKKGIDELLMQGHMNMLTYQGVSSIANLHS